MPLRLALTRRVAKRSFEERERTNATPTPQELFDQAVSNIDYSDEACIRSCAPKTVILSGVEAGEEKAWTPGKNKKRAARLKAIFSRKAPAESDRVTAAEGRQIYRDRDGDTPAYAHLGVTWVEQGIFQGRKAHFVRLHFQHHHGANQWVQCVEVTLRLWKSGDAIRSIAHKSSTPLEAVEPPAALALAGNAPEIVLYTPRAAVGRPAGTPVDCFWDGHFQPGDRWQYFAEARAPQYLASVRPKPEDVWSMLVIFSQGDYSLKQPAPDFELGLIVLSDGKPFEITAYSTSSHQHGGHELCRHLWSPYNPVKINGSMRLVPKGQQSIGRLDFGSDEMKTKLKKLINWSKAYDTIWFGTRYGCIDNESSPSRCCGVERCRICPPHTPASTCRLCNPRPRPNRSHDEDESV